MGLKTNKEDQKLYGVRLFRQVFNLQQLSIWFQKYTQHEKNQYQEASCLETVTVFMLPLSVPNELVERLQLL